MAFGISESCQSRGQYTFSKTKETLTKRTTHTETKAKDTDMDRKRVT